jgi:hypothetical protein
MNRLFGYIAWAILTLFLLSLDAPVAFSKNIELVAPFSDFSLREPPDPPPPGSPQFYSSTAVISPWSIVQWNVPGGKLPPFTLTRQGPRTSFHSRAAEVAVEIQRESGQTSVQLSQNGEALPCSWANGHPRESDLFIAPKDPRWSGHDTALHPYARSLSIGALSALILRAEVSAEAAPLSRPKGCAVSQGAAIVALILRNTTGPKPQILFYQLALNHVCGPGSAQRMRQCAVGQTKFTYFSRKQPFGVDDFAPLLGVPALGNGQSRHITINLLPRLAQIIAAGPPEMDRNMAHWQFDGTYLGQHIWGDIRLATRWRSFGLTAVTSTGQ